MKNLSRVFLFAFVISLALVSNVLAASNSTISLSTSDSVIYVGELGSFIISNTNSTYDLTSLEFKQDSSLFDVLTEDNVITSLSKGSSATIPFALSNPLDLPVGKYGFSIIAQALLNGESVQKSIPLTYYKGLCGVGTNALGPKGTNLTIRDVSISNSGDKDEEWKLLDTLEIEVKIKNEGDDTIDDVQVEMALFDTNGNDVTGDLDFSNSGDEEIDLGNIRKSDDKTATFRFKVTSDIDTGNYRLAFRAYSDGNEDEDCVDSASTSDLDNGVFQSIEVVEEDDDDKLVAVDDIKLNAAEYTCGDVASGSFRVVNVGNDEQDQILVGLTNRDLALNQDLVIKNNLDRGESKLVDFSFTIPQNLKDGSYPIQFRTSYDYDDGDDEYDTVSDETYTATLKVIGCSASSNTGSGSTGTGSLNEIDISPALKSAARAGEKLVVDAVLTNTGLSTVSFTLDASGYQSWASLDSISTRSISLESGESQTVTFTFTVDDDASGSQSFSISGRNTAGSISQPVEVKLASTSSGFSFSGNSGLLWIIGIINVVLIVLIIIVAVRLSRR